MRRLLLTFLITSTAFIVWLRVWAEHNIVRAKFDLDEVCASFWAVDVTDG